MHTALRTDGPATAEPDLLTRESEAGSPATCLAVGTRQDGQTPPNVAASVLTMTLHRGEYEVGVRELHDRLSKHLEQVERGAQVLVTRRGRAIARLPGAAAYADMRARALTTDLAGITVAIVGVDDLIRMKQTTARPGDLEDIAAITAVAQDETPSAG